MCDEGCQSSGACSHLFMGNIKGSQPDSDLQLNVSALICFLASESQMLASSGPYTVRLPDLAKMLGCRV